MARTWAAKTVAGSTCSLSSPRRPPPCTAATVMDRTAGPPSGASDPSTTASPSTTRMATPRRATTVPTAAGLAARSAGPTRRSAHAVARPLTTVAMPTPPAQTPAVSNKRTPEAGQRQQRTVGLPEKDATERQAAERPRHADGLGQACWRRRRRAPVPAAAA